MLELHLAYDNDRYLGRPTEGTKGKDEDEGEDMSWSVVFVAVSFSATFWFRLHSSILPSS